MFRGVLIQHQTTIPAGMCNMLLRFDSWWYWWKHICCYNRPLSQRNNLHRGLTSDKTRITKSLASARRRASHPPPPKISKWRASFFCLAAKVRNLGYIVMLRARMFRSLIPVLMIKERNIRARNITI